VKLSELLSLLTEEEEVDWVELREALKRVPDPIPAGVRAATEKNYARAGAVIATVLLHLGDALAAMNLRELSERLSDIRDRIRQETLPEVRPDEAEAPRGRKLFEQREGLTPSEIRRIAEHIVAENLVGAFERRMMAFDEASGRLYDWIQNLPPFPSSKSDKWDIRQIFEIEDELLRQLRGVGVVRDAEIRPGEGR
jgi:hypothetical protein